MPEDWGGDTIFVNVSAHTGEGIEKLLEAILLQAEVLELQAPAERRRRRAWCSRPSIEKGRGAVATVLVQRGTLQVGDTILAGEQFGRIRALFDETRRADQVGRTVAARAGAGSVGAAECRRRAAGRRERAQGEGSGAVSPGQVPRRAAGAAGRDRSSRTSSRRWARKGRQSIQLLVKADVQGSAEALTEALTKLGTDEVTVKVIASGVGGITESDVMLAAASNAQIIGFDVRADAAARSRHQGTARRGPLLQRDLRGHRRRAGRDDRHAGAGDQGADPRPGRGPRGVPVAASSAPWPAAW